MSRFRLPQLPASAALAASCLCWCCVSRGSAASQPPAARPPPPTRPAERRQASGLGAAAAAEVSLLDAAECFCFFPHCWNSTPACLLVPAWLLPSPSPFPFYLLFFLSGRSARLSPDCLLNSHLSRHVLLLFFMAKFVLLLKMCV